MSADLLPECPQWAGLGRQSRRGTIWVSLWLPGPQALELSLTVPQGELRQEAEIQAEPPLEPGHSDTGHGVLPGIRLLNQPAPKDKHERACTIAE